MEQRATEIEGNQRPHTVDNKSPEAHKLKDFNTTKKDVTSKDHPTEVYKQVNASFRHRHGGTQQGALRAQNHLVHNHNKVTFEHHKASHKELRRSYEAESGQYQKICLEEMAPADYVEKKIKASELIDDESPQKGRYEISKTEILKIDKETLDDWVPRDSRLIRLVGPHPLNAEPPLITLVKEGLITPNAIHYVRNHGPVPKIKKSEHTIKISGLVDKPKELTMDEIRKFPSINIFMEKGEGEKEKKILLLTTYIPVTITCDGNRRKELNTIKKSRGFGWGAGGTSCAFWKGALLRDILLACGVKNSKDGAKYVCFDGAERLHKGPYGTSIPLSHAMDETNDVMIAYEMNNEELPPDHGFPARLVIPGMVGGRQVKWLKEIRVTEKETDNFYHWHDNKVLPPSVDNTEAIEEGWFYDPNFTLYELNINSVISSPAHGTEITLDKLPQSPILVEGYAYSGGGRKITRVEVSLDGGKSWSLSQIMYPKSMPRHDFKYWTWCHWMVRVEPWKLMRSSEIVVRAHDVSCNVQPSEATWNLLGMMNNSWYRVKIEIHDHPTPIDPTQPPTLRFIHPVMPGAIPGGWKIRPADMPLRPRGESWEVNTKFTMEEVAKHNTKDDCWFVFRGSVYNVTSYLHDHPAGPGPLLANAGKDATIPFEMAHGEDVYKYLDQFKIGELDGIDPGDTDGCAWVVGTREIGNVVPLPPSDVALDPTGWLNIKLTKREDISPDTRLFTFKHDKEKLPLGIPVGQYILMAAFIDNKLVARPYTPVRPVLKKEDNGEIHFVIKVYFPQDEKPGGQMTMLLENMKIGESVKVRGPYGHVFYEGDGNFLIHGTPLFGNKISLVAGGSGITPCYQIIRKVCADPDDNTEISLVFANKSIDDILLKKELDELAKKHKNFKLWYVIDKAPEDQEWKYSTGHIDQKILQEHLFPAGPDSFCFCCGPPAMVEKACLPNLEAMGFDFNNLVEF